MGPGYIQDLVLATALKGYLVSLATNQNHYTDTTTSSIWYRGEGLYQDGGSGALADVEIPFFRQL